MIDSAQLPIIPEMADLVTIATDMVKACARSDWARAYEHADPKFVRGFTEFMSIETWRQVRQLAGELLEVGSTTSFRHLLATPPVRTVFVNCKFERMVVTVQVSFTHEDKILGLAILTKI